MSKLYSTRTIIKKISYFCTILTLVLFHLPHSTHAAVLWSDEPPVDTVHVQTGLVCQAIDATTFAGCIAQANTGVISEIHVLTMITCDGTQSCNFKLNDIKKPLIIRGISENISTTPVGFKRSANYQSAILTVSNSSGPIRINTLMFDEGINIASGAPGTLWTNTSCPVTAVCSGDSLDINFSQNIIVSNVIFKEPKNFGIGINDSSNIWIRYSRFHHAWVHGIWLNNANHLPLSSGIHIENSYFIDNRSNAIMISTAPPGASDPLGVNTITNNYFSHNHNAALYYTCSVTGKGPCPGGELDIEQNSNNIVVENNVFRNGYLDEDPAIQALGLGVAGIEIAQDYVQNINMIHNKFADLTGSAIALDTLVTTPSTVINIQAMDNYYSDVDTLFNNQPIYGLSRLQPVPENTNIICNIGAVGCGDFVKPEGSIIASPYPCHLKNGSCAANVIWKTEGVLEPLSIIQNNSSVVANPDKNSGYVTDSAVTASPVHIDLYAGYTLLDSTMAYGY